MVLQKNNYLQRTNKEITHLQATNDEKNYGNDDSSIASNANVSVTSARSDRSATKSGWSGLQNFHTQSKIEISEDAHGDGVILLDDG